MTTRDDTALPKPYYQDEWVTIYHADCSDILPFLPVVDLLLTAPPYGIGLDMTMNHGTTKTIHKIDYLNDAPPPAYCFELMYERSREQIIWGCNYFRDNIRDVGRIVHDKQLEIKGTKLKWSEADIASCSLQKRITIFSYRWNGNRQGETINWKNIGEDKRWHPTQKPVPLMVYCIENYSKPGQTLLDPFLGSGTTAVAAKKCKRYCVGIEAKEEYCEVAAKRCAQDAFDFSGIGGDKAR